MGNLLGRRKDSNDVASAPSSESLVEQAEELRKEGNIHANKGSFGVSIGIYDQALSTLADAAKKGEDKDSISQLRLALHLNLALTHLRHAAMYGSSPEDVSLPAFASICKQSLEAAIDHCTKAVAIDPDSERGHLRRGCARSRLCEVKGYENLADKATADLQKVIDLYPDNKEAERQLKVHKEVDARRRIQKDLEHLVRQDAGQRRPVVSAENIHYQRDQKSLLADINLDVFAGRCLGIIGESTSDRAMLSNVFAGKISPSRGQVKHHGRGMVPPGASVSTAAWILVSSLCSQIFAVAALGKDPLSAVNFLNQTMTSAELGLAALIFIAALFIIKLFVDRHHARGMHCNVAHLTNQDEDASHLAGKSPYDILGGVSRSTADALLKAAGLQDVASAELSPAQAQACLLLRSLAVGADVLVCEDVVDGLEDMQKARILHMIKRAKDERGTAILFITSELEQLRLIADNVGYLCEGSIVELGPTNEVLDKPRNESTGQFLSKSKSNEALAKNFAKLANDKDICGRWL